jgi:nicotinate dehydrogenase subunit B
LATLEHGLRLLGRTRERPCRQLGRVRLILSTPAVGTAKPKNHTQYKIVGQGVPRRDIPGKILATTEFCHHVVLPKMMHGRMIRPPIANGVPVKVNESSLAGIPGARVVWKKNLLGVVAESEWDAIKASRQLKVTWSKTRPPFPKMDQLYQHIRAAPPVATDAGNSYFGKTPYDAAPTLDALARSARRIEAEYELPFQSHARMAPSVGVADVQGTPRSSIAILKRPKIAARDSL